MTVANKITFTENTLNVLKNFSGICSNILIKPGNTIRTMSTMKNILAEASIEEDFDREIGIWDLNQFLGTISLLDNPEFEFEDGYVDISGGNGASVRYYYSEPSVLTTPKHAINMPDDIAIRFELKQKDLLELQKASSVLGLNDLCVQSTGDSLDMVAVSKKVQSSNTYSVNIGEVLEDTPLFQFYFKVENLKMLNGDYDVEIAKTSVAQFTHKTLDLKYWIALESDSTYNG